MGVGGGTIPPAADAHSIPLFGGGGRRLETRRRFLIAGRGRGNDDVPRRHGGRTGHYVVYDLVVIRHDRIDVNVLPSIAAGEVHTRYEDIYYFL